MPLTEIRGLVAFEGSKRLHDHGTLGPPPQLRAFCRSHGAPVFKEHWLDQSLKEDEDSLICRNAREIWQELDMPRSRRELLRKGEVEFAAGRLSRNFNRVPRLIMAYLVAGRRAGLQPDDGGRGQHIDTTGGDSNCGGPGGVGQIVDSLTVAVDARGCLPAEVSSAAATAPS